MRALLLVLPAVALVVGWWGWSTWSSSRVEVSWSPECEGTDVSTYRVDETSPSSSDEELDGQYVVDARPGFRCTLAVQVHNGSHASVHLSAVDGAFLGKGAGAEVKGLTSDDLPRLERGDGVSSIDARYPLDRDVGAGETVTLDLVLGWRESGCNSGGLLWSAGFPSVELSVLGLPHEVLADQYFVLRTHDGDHVAPRYSTC